MRAVLSPTPLFSRFFALSAALLPNSTRRKPDATAANADGLTSWLSRTISRLICCCSASVFPSMRSVMACDEKPSLYMRSMESCTKVKSFMTRSVSFGRKLRNGIFVSVSEESSGTISISVFLSFDSCVSTSNVRMESISSPKKSRRNGSSLLYEYTSRILPRRANWPGSYT